MGKNDILEGLSWIVNMANDWLVHNSPPELLNKRQQLLHEKEKFIRNLIEQMPKEEEIVPIPDKPNPKMIDYQYQAEKGDK